MRVQAYLFNHQASNAALQSIFQTALCLTLLIAITLYLFLLSGAVDNSQYQA